jgi:hypothetical protein
VHQRERDIGRRVKADVIPKFGSLGELQGYWEFVGLLVISNSDASNLSRRHGDDVRRLWFHLIVNAPRRFFLRYDWTAA